MNFIPPGNPPCQNPHVRVLQGTLSRLRFWLQLERWLHGLLPSLFIFLFGSLFAWGWYVLWKANFFSSLSFVLIEGSFLGVVFYRYWWRPFRFRLTDQKIALLLERHFRNFDSRLISAVQFQKEEILENLQHPISLFLIHALHQDIAQAVQRENTKALIVWKPVVVWAALVLFLFSLFGLGQYFYPGQMGHAISALLDPQSLIPGRMGLGSHRKSNNSDWAVGDIRLSYHFPPYSGLPSRVEANTDGSIQALKGTLVRLEATSSARLESAELVLDKNQRLPMQIGEDGRTFRGELVLVKSGSYSFSVRLGLYPKKKILERSSREFSIEVLPDNFPKVVLEEPLEDLETNEKGQIKIEYSLEDDFGLMKLLLVTKNKEEKEWPISTFAPNKANHSGTYIWNLKDLGTNPGEEILFFLRVFDNDTVSGPKFSDSAVRHLTVLSGKKIRHDLLVRQEEVFEEMIHVLGDHLEFDDLLPIRKSIDAEKSEPQNSQALADVRQKLAALQSRINRLMEDLEQIALEMKQNQAPEEEQKIKDQLKIDAIKGLTGELAKIESRWARILIRDSLQWDPDNWKKQGSAIIAGALKEGTSGMEDVVLAFETLIYGQKVDEILSEGEDVLKNLDDLKAAMENLNPDNLASAKKMLQDFEDSYLKYLQKMAQASTETPLEEFINVDALKEMQEESLPNLVKKIREMLDRGDLEGAKKEMAKLQEKMSNNLKEMQASSAEKQEEMFKKLSENIEKLDEVIAGQKRLLKETESLRDQLEKHRQKEQSAQYQKFLNQQLGRIKEIRKNLKEFEKGLALDSYNASFIRRSLGLESDEPLDELLISETLDQLEEELKQQDIEDAFRQAQESSAHLQQLQERAELIQKFYGSNGKSGGKSVVSNVDPLSQSIPLADAIQSDLREIMQNSQNQKIEEGRGQSQAPGLNEQAKIMKLKKGQEGIRKRSLEVDDSLNELSKELPFLNQDFFGQEEGENRLPHMQNAIKNLDKGQVSDAIPNERSGLYRLQEARDQLQKALQQARQQAKRPGGGLPPLASPGYKPMGEQEGEGEGSSDRDVQIPGEEEFKVPEEFRREILDAMKNPAPKGYEKLNRDYYERLVR